MTHVGREELCSGCFGCRLSHQSGLKDIFSMQSHPQVGIPFLGAPLSPVLPGEKVSQSQFFCPVSPNGCFVPWVFLQYNNEKTKRPTVRLERDFVDGRKGIGFTFHYWCRCCCLLLEVVAQTSADRMLARESTRTIPALDISAALKPHLVTTSPPVDVWSLRRGDQQQREREDLLSRWRRWSGDLHPFREQPITRPGCEMYPVDVHN